DPRFPVKDGESISSAVKFQAGPAGADIAHVRFVALTEFDLGAIDLGTVIETTTTEGVTVDAVQVRVSDLVDDEGGPWGRFADLPDRWLAALLFGDGVAAEPQTADKPDVSKVASGDTLLTLMRILGRRTVQGGANEFAEVPTDPKKRLELASRIVQGGTN